MRLLFFALTWTLSSANAEVPAYLLLSQGAPAATAENLLTADQAVNWAVDKVLSAPEDTLPTVRGIVKRSLRLALIDLPVDYMPMILQHEAFGHGTRFREAGYGSYALRFQRPWPYGMGHGRAFPNEPPPDVSVDESLAIRGAGMDANDLFARALRMRWVADGHLERHQAMLYALNAGNRPVYVLRMPRGAPDFQNPGDVSMLISMINTRNNGSSLSGRPLDVEDIQYRTLPALLDPFAFVALTALFKDYVVEGRESRPLPMASFGGWRFLPLLRTGFCWRSVERLAAMCRASPWRRDWSRAEAFPSTGLNEITFSNGEPWIT